MKQWLFCLIGCIAATTAFAANDPDQEWQQSLNAARERLAQAARELSTLQRRRLQDSASYLTGAGGEGDRAIIGISLAGHPDEKPGVMVVGVSPRSPAATAGIHSRDVIMSIAGVPLNNIRGREAVNKLLDTMREVAPGDEVEIEYLRGDIQRRVTLVTQGYTEDAAIDWSMDGGPSYDVFAADPTAGQLFARWGELAMVNLSASLGEYFGADQGVLVVHRAKSLPLYEGDVLLRIGGQAPSGAAQAAQLLAMYQPGETIDVDVLRRGKSVEIEFEHTAKIEMTGPGQTIQVQRARRVQ